MALGKTAKIWLGIFGGMLLIFIAGIVTLNLYFSGERLKGMILPKIEQATHRTVSVGNVSFSIFPSIGITLERLTISNPSGRTFHRQDFLSLDKLVFSVKLMPLFNNRLIIDNMLIDHPVLYLEMDEHGASNYSDTPSGDEGDREVNISVEKEASFLLSNFEIKNGIIEWVDKRGNGRMTLAGYNQTARLEVKPGEKVFHVSVNIAIDKVSYGTLTAWYLSETPLVSSATLLYDVNNDRLTIGDASVKLNDLPLTVSGSLARLTQDVRDVDLTIASPGVQMSQILSLVPPEMLKATSGLTSSGDVAFSAAVKGYSSEKMTPGITGMFSVKNGTIQYASLPKSITNIHLMGSFERPMAEQDSKGIGMFSIETMTASLGNSKIAASMTMKDFSNPLVQATVSGSMNLNEIKDYYPLEPGTEISGTMKSDVTLNGKAKTPANMKAGGSIGFADVTIKTPASGRPLRNLNGAVMFNNTVMESKQLAMKIGESDLNLSFAVKNYLGLVMEDANKAGAPSASVTVTSKQLRTADLMPESAPPSSAATGKPQPQSAAMFPGLNIDANVNIGKLITEDFEFNNARGVVSFSKGIATLKNFSVNAFEGTVVSRGTLDLRDEKKRPFNLDLNVSGVQANTFLSKFTSFGNNLFGKFSMNTTMKGDVNDTLGLNTQTLAGNGQVQITDGKLLGVALLTKVAEFTGLNDLREPHFNNWANKFTISDGKMVIDNLTMTALSTDFVLSGSHGLDGAMDQTLAIRLSPALSSKARLPGIADQLVQFFKDNDGRLMLTFAVTGTMSNPVIRLDTRPQEEMAKKALEQKLLEGKKKAEDELKKKAEEELKKLFKRP